MNDPNRADPRRLKETRTRLGHSVDYVARMLDAKPREIEKWERGDAAPSAEELSLLARLYGVDPKSLTEGASPTEDPTKSASEDPTKREGQTKNDDPTKDASQNPRGSDSSGGTARDHGDRKTEPSGREAEARTAAGGSFDAYLTKGETVLWSGRPAPRIKAARDFPKKAGLYAVFSILVILSELYEVLRGEAAMEFLFPVMALLLLVLFGTEIYTLVLRRSACYAVTNRRVLIVSRLGKEECLEYRYDLRGFYPRFRKERGTYGSIFFSNADFCKADEEYEQDSLFRFGRRSRGFRMPPDPRRNLICVEDAEAVRDLLNKLSENEPSESTAESET